MLLLLLFRPYINITQAIMSFIARGHYSCLETIASYTDGVQPLCCATFHGAILTRGWLLMYQVSVAWRVWEWDAAPEVTCVSRSRTVHAHDAAR